MTGNISLPSVTFAGHTLACQMCANSPQMLRRTTSPQSPNLLPPNPQARLAHVQPPPPPPNYLLYASQHRSHYRARVGHPGYSGNPGPRLRSSLRRPRPHLQTSLSQSHGRPPPLPHHRYRPAYTRTSVSSARPSARSTSRQGRPMCLPPVRVLRNARGAGRCAGSRPSYKTRTQTWMLTLMSTAMETPKTLTAMPMPMMRIRRLYPRPPLSVPFHHRHRRHHPLRCRPPPRDD